MDFLKLVLYFLIWPVLDIALLEVELILIFLENFWGGKIILTRPLARCRPAVGAAARLPGRSRRCQWRKDLAAGNSFAAVGNSGRTGTGTAR